jgi:hypothetical protein|eukprot:g12645.t1
MKSYFGTKPAKEKTYVKELLPISLKLNEKEFKYTLTNGKGRWKSTGDGTSAEEKHIEEFQNEIDRLRKRIAVIEQEKIREAETRFMIEFKNKLLLEMLAVAQLDADKSNSSLEAEKLKTEALKFELANLSMAHKDLH